MFLSLLQVLVLTLVTVEKPARQPTANGTGITFDAKGFPLLPNLDLEAVPMRVTRTVLYEYIKTVWGT
jgi:hypothetical protein